MAMNAHENILDLTQETFDEELARSPLPLLVDFTAPWCPPCRLMLPHVGAIADAFAGRIRVGQVSSDDNPMLTDRFSVMSLPTLLLIKDGAVVGQIVGAVPRARIEELVRQAL
jgi:thioredoxin 1